MPDPTSAWPPPALAPHLAEQSAWHAWWTGDTYALGRYAEPSTRTTALPSTSGRLGIWGRRRTEQNPAPARRLLHVPAAGDVAQTSADLLFGEPPAIRLPDDAPQAAELQARLDTLLEDDGLTNDLHHAAEQCAALGGIYLRPLWDVTLADRPLTTVVDQSRAIPEMRAGILAAVTFYEDAEETAGGAATGTVWRHLERHEPGRIVHSLHRGTPYDLGPPQPLDAHPLTSWLAGVVDAEGAVNTTAISDRLLVSYIPNAPSRRHRDKAYGRADIAGSEPILGALDETWTSWLRDIRLGQSRLLVPETYLDVIPGAAGGRARLFDTDAEIFTPMAGMEEGAGHPPQITPVQFAIRVAEHAATASALFENVVTSCGYAPQTFGIHTEGAISGTAHQLRELRTHRLVGRKQRAFRPAVEHHAHMLLSIGHALFGWAAPVRPTLTWPENDVEEPKARAETINLLASAKAASIRTRVRMAQPQLDTTEVDAEVDAIQADAAAELGATANAFALDTIPAGTEPHLGP